MKRLSVVLFVAWMVLSGQALAVQKEGLFITGNAPSEFSSPFSYLVGQWYTKSAVKGDWVVRLKVSEVTPLLRITLRERKEGAREVEVFYALFPPTRETMSYFIIRAAHAVITALESNSLK